MSHLGEFAFAVKAPILVPRSYREWKRLRSVDRWLPEQLADYSAEQSRRMAQFAFESSPFYREYYGDHGFAMKDFGDPAVFDALPLLTKEMLRENAARVATSEAT